MEFEVFYKLLNENIEKSQVADRKGWLTIIYTHNFELLRFKNIFNEASPKVNRFLWMISELGALYPAYLRSQLPALFDLSKNTNFDFKAAFASYWNMVGVPEENEGEAIDLLFKWIASPLENVTIKSRAIFTLHQLVIKYPDLNHEFQAVLNAQLKKYSKDFDKRILKVLHQLN